LYIGPVEEGKFHGEGKLFTLKGELIYEGDFEMGFYHGRGKLYNYLVKVDPKKINIKNEIVSTYMSLDAGKYVKDLKRVTSRLNISFKDDEWVEYEGFF